MVEKYLDAAALSDLQKSGITQEAAIDSGMYSVNHAEISVLVGMDAKTHPDGSNGYVIPYLNMDGKTPLTLDASRSIQRIRLTSATAETVRDGKKIKPLRYVSQPNTPWGVYIPNGFLDCFHAENDESDQPVLVITEGEKKALSGVLRGIPTLAIPGVSMWHNPFYPKLANEKLNPATPIHPILEDIIRNLLSPKWTILVLYDYDGPVTNRMVVNSMTTFAQALRHQLWHSVAVAGIPCGKDDLKKMGLDDWLLESGETVVRDSLISLSKNSVYMPYIQDVIIGKVPTPKQNPRSKVELAAYFLYHDAEAQKSPANAETFLALNPAFASMRMEELQQIVADSMRWVKSAGNNLNARLTWHAIADPSTWIMEEWDAKNYSILHKVLPGVPAAWIHRYFSMSDDGFNTPSRRVAEIRGFANDGKLQELQFDAEMESGKATWIEHGFRNVVDKGLEEWRRITQHQLSTTHTQVTAIVRRGWLDVAHNGYSYQVYCYGKRAVIPDPDNTSKDTPRIEAVRLSKAQQDSSAAILTRGDAAVQKKWFSELLLNSPAFSGLAGFSCAAALMEFIPEAENGIIHLFGDSSAGKTSTLQILASMLGSGDSKGRYSQIMGWRITSNGLEAPLMAHSDAPIFMDELHLLPANEDLSELLYMVANGAGKARMKADTTERAAMRWRVQMLSNGEKSVEGSLGTHKNGTKGLQTFTGGLKVRVMDIPFDKLDLMPDPEAIPYIISRYGSSSQSSSIGKKASAEALERAAETDCGWLWSEMVGFIYHWSKHSEWSPRKAYAELSDRILADIPAEASNIVKRRVKHVAAALVGLTALVAILDIPVEDQQTIIRHGRDWLQGVLLAIGIGDSVDGAESDHVILKVDEHISTHPERFIMGSMVAAGVQYGWIRNGGNVAIPVADGLPVLASSLNLDAKRLKSALLSNGWLESPIPAPHLKKANDKIKKVRTLISPNPYFSGAGDAD